MHQKVFVRMQFQKVCTIPMLLFLSGAVDLRCKSREAGGPVVSDMGAVEHAPLDPSHSFSLVKFRDTFRS